MLDKAMLTEVLGWELHPPDIPAGVEFGSHNSETYLVGCFLLHIASYCSWTNDVS